MNEKQIKFYRKVFQVVDFCMRHTDKCFSAWSRDTVAVYVAFHAISGGLFIRRKNGVVVAAGFAWPENEKRLKERCKDGVPAFDWNLPDDPDCLLIQEVIADRESCALFLHRATRQWPCLKRAFTFRRKPDLKLVELSLDRMIRFYGDWNLLKEGK